MKRLLIVSLLFAASCNLEESQRTPSLTSDTAKQARITAIDTAKTHLKPLINKKQLLGVWESTGKEYLTTEISEDSIRYTEHFESHNYKLKGDSIFIHYADFVIAGKVYFHHDTLIIQSEDGKSKYVKLNR